MYYLVISHMNMIYLGHIHPYVLCPVSPRAPTTTTSSSQIISSSSPSSFPQSTSPSPSPQSKISPPCTFMAIHQRMANLAQATELKNTGFPVVICSPNCAWRPTWQDPTSLLFSYIPHNPGILAAAPPDITV